VVRIYTRSGDEGQTSLFDGSRVAKTHERVQAGGELDELNACLGLARAHLSGSEEVLEELIDGLQRDLFELGARLADPRRDGEAAPDGGPSLSTARLEDLMDEWTAELPELKAFILPGGAPAAAAIQLARSVCRRAERAILPLSDEGALHPELMAWLNRLSDLLFVMARLINHRAGCQEPTW
jgi:cob(I)alamin adenosyltransferase